ncbi:hypothetical protein [Streptomyces sp. MN13]
MLSHDDAQMDIVPGFTKGALSGVGCSGSRTKTQMYGEIPVDRRQGGLVRHGRGRGSARHRPPQGHVALHTHPDNGAYREVLPGKFGEAVALPAPLRMEIPTDGFLTYGDSPSSRARHGVAGAGP